MIRKWTNLKQILFINRYTFYNSASSLSVNGRYHHLVEHSETVLTKAMVSMLTKRQNVDLTIPVVKDFSSGILSVLEVYIG